MIYPNDANGDALRRMEAEGDDLSRPRNMDFTVVFSNKNSAEEFVRHFQALTCAEIRQLRPLESSNSPAD
jgi:hypothetical protein